MDTPVKIEEQAPAPAPALTEEEGREALRKNLTRAGELCIAYERLYEWRVAFLAEVTEKVKAARQGRRGKAPTTEKGLRKALGEEAWIALEKQHYQRAEDAQKVIRAEQDALKEARGSLCKTLKPRAGKVWATVRWIYGEAYRSQGYGAEKYTRHAAQQVVDDLEHLGLSGEIIPTQDGGFDVVALLEDAELDVEIFRFAPNISLDEWVRRCWKAQCNPRVYSPFLPHGYEEKNGLDFFGGRKAP